MKDQHQLHLFSVFADFVVAMPVASVERLVLPFEVEAAPSANPSVPLVAVGRERYASFNLGRLLAAPRTSGAWALLRLSHRGATLPVALEIGACLVVRDRGRVSPLSPSMFRSRGRAIAGAFAVPADIAAAAPSHVGLLLEPSLLLTIAEEDAAVSALRRKTTATSAPPPP